MFEELVNYQIGIFGISLKKLNAYAGRMRRCTLLIFLRFFQPLHRCVSYLSYLFG